MAGIGQRNLVKVPVDGDRAMTGTALAAAIRVDRAAGLVPAGVILWAGGTSVGASDRIGNCIAVARAEGLATHVDAAWAGSAMICPEFRQLWAGIEGADSIVTEPRLSLFTFALSDEAATAALLQRINDDGRIYLTQTRVDGRFAIRVQVGLFDCQREDVMVVAKTIKEMLVQWFTAPTASPEA